MNASRIAAGAVVASALFIVAPHAARASADADSQRVIHASSTAMGISALRNVRVIRIDGKISAVGLSGTGTQWLGVTTGQLAESASLPPLVQGDGYDGNVAWNRDGSGLVWNDGSEAGRSIAINNAFVSTYSLWKPDAGGAAVTFKGTKVDKGRTYDVLQVTPPKSKLPVDLWFDRTTHVLACAVQVSGPNTSKTTFSNFRKSAGLQVPYRVAVESTTGNNSDTTITRVAFDPAGGASHLARPRSDVHDFSIANGTSTTVPFDLVENHVYLNVMLNGKGPYRFIFDTGGQNVVDPAVAKEVGAFGKGSAQGSGVGAATESLSFATVDSLQVGDATLKKQLFAVAPVRQGFGISGGQAVDGLIGWEVLARYVTSFNYGSNQVVLTMPSAATAAPGAHVIPFVFNGTQPQIPCTIDSIATQCTIDTGARDTLTFYGPFLADNPKVRPASLTQNGITGFGFGGPSFGVLGRVQSVGLDGLTLNDLVGDFSTQTQGAFANPFVAANLGGNLLRRFDVTFDYYKETMAIVPNAAFSQSDFYERAGLFLINNGGKFTVADARPGTPAAQAGIAKGDVITSVDGVPATSMTLGAVRQNFLKPAGTVLHLGITAKDGASKTVTLTLRDYV